MILVLCLLGSQALFTNLFAQKKKSSENFNKASRKIEKGIEKNNTDTLAQGYFDLGESYYQKGELEKSETYYQKSKILFEKTGDAEGMARSSRALGKVQEDLNKNKEALKNYKFAQKSGAVSGDNTTKALNENDIRRLTLPDSLQSQRASSLLQNNVQLGMSSQDTNEIVANYSRMGDVSLRNREIPAALNAFKNAYKFSTNNPEQALRYNQRIADLYAGTKNFPEAIETKQEVLKQDFVQNSTQLKAREITSLANIYILKKEDSTAIHLLNESYALSVKNGHTLEARESVRKLDSIFQGKGKKELSLALYKNFLVQLPDIIFKDSSLADNRVVAETELRIKELETEKALKDALIRRKNIFNYSLIASVILLAGLLLVILYVLRKLRIKNKKIALQSLRREMNPHFIFNSLNSINQFIANSNELEANRYLTKFSTLMRRVMENSKGDFVLLSKEIELLENYLELEKSRFADKFDFTFHVDESLLSDDRLYIPGMLIQPHLENAIWHGLRYQEEKGLLQLVFSKNKTGMDIVIEDNGIGISESKKNKTVNQKKHAGRGITNTMERIKILNELYGQNIQCDVEDKQAPGHGVKVRLVMPLLKNPGHED